MAKKLASKIAGGFATVSVGAVVVSALSAVGAAVAAPRLPAPPMMTEPAKDYRFAFEAYFGGLLIAEADGKLAWADERYTMAFKAASAGMLDWVMKIDQTASSEGRLRDRPEAEHHRSDSDDGKKRIWVELAFTPETVEIVDAKPHPKTEETRSPIPPEQLKGAVDPLTAVLALGLTASAQDKCEGKVAVFDGRRRYDTVLSDVGREDYKGPAGVRETLKCDFRFVRRGGYKAKDKRWKGITGTAWLQRVGDGLPYLPVRVQVETNYGTALIHMVSAGPK